MLYFPQTRIELTVERPLVAGTTVNAEGCALVGSMTAGVFGVKPATGAGFPTERLAGVAINNPIQPLSLPFIETVTVSAAGLLVLSNTPIGGSIFVTNAAGTQITSVGSNPTSGQYMADGVLANALDTNVSNAGQSFTVSYRYSPTVMQAMMLQGNVLPGGPAGAYLGQVGLITRGDVFTSEFDTSANWSTAVGVTLAANGVFTATATAANAIDGVQIIQLPTVGSAYLGLSINVPN